MQTKGLRKRPFEFVVAFLVFILGFYALVNPNYPPAMAKGWEVIVLNIEALYFVLAGGTVIATFFTRPKWPVASIVAQMFGWLFVGFAGIMSIITRVFIDDAPIFHDAENTYLSIVSITVWTLLSTAAFVRYFDIRTWYKSVGRK